MKYTFSLLAAFIISFAGFSQNLNDEQLVRQTANSLFNSFNKHDYSDMPGYTTEDCFMVNPMGLRGKRTNETPALFKRAHETFLKNLSLRVDSMGIRFITRDVAIATVISQQIVAPASGDGNDAASSKQEIEKIISTMVVLKKNNKWLITQYQNTFISNQSATSISR